MSIENNNQYEELPSDDNRELYKPYDSRKSHSERKTPWNKSSFLDEETKQVGKRNLEKIRQEMENAKNNSQKLDDE